jgi:ribonuclease HII
MGRILGIDEAGRGPVLGPLVMACVSLTPEKAEELERFGIRDSKKYGSGNKAKMARIAARPAIYSRCDYSLIIVEPETIDAYVDKGRLDDLERETALKLLEMVGAAEEDTIYCDGEPIFGRLTEKWPNLVAENKADDKYVAVSAASIIAKTVRDEEMDRILRTYEPFYGQIKGGGYVNAGTRAFLEAYEAKNGRLPPETRLSWKWRKKPEVADHPNILDLING